MKSVTGDLFTFTELKHCSETLVFRLLPSVWLEKKHLHRYYSDKRAEQHCYFGNQWHSLRSRAHASGTGASSQKVICSAPPCRLSLLPATALSCNPFLLCLLWEGEDEAPRVLCCDLGLFTLLLCAGVCCQSCI